VSSPRRNSSRLGVLCLAITYLLLQLGGAWHLARQSHARCAAHGEWIDVARTSPAGAHASPSSERGPLVESSSSTREHEHCSIVEASRVRAIVCESVLAETFCAPLVSIERRSDDAPIQAGFARYLLAPKQSPPC
jgi:hypothetical protein